MNSPDPHNSPQNPTWFQGVKLPASRVQIADITTVLFLVERAPLEKILTNLFSTAAVCRAIACERGEAPVLKVMGENKLHNSMYGVGQNLFAQRIVSGDHALLLTAASLYRRQMAQLIGEYALAGATLVGCPDLVDDDVVIGHRDDPHQPIRSFVEYLVRDSRDPHVQKLLQLARLSEDVESKDPDVVACRSALTTLQTTSLPFVRSGSKERPDVMTTIHNMIFEWQEGATIPAVCHTFIEQHDEAAEIAQSIWLSAPEIAREVFQLIEIPYEETDEVVRERLRDLYTKDPRAKFVVQKRDDRPATALTYEEALAFEQRLGAGEDAQGILNEVEELMNLRHDRSCAVDIAMGEMKDRDPKDTLETILARSQYIPDPDGVCYTLLKYPDGDFYRQFARSHIPLITHTSSWVCDMKTGEARPFNLSFQGQYLDAFLRMIEV